VSKIVGTFRKQNLTSRDDMVGAIQAVNDIGSTEATLGACLRSLDGKPGPEICLSVSFPDFPGYDFDGDLPYRKQAVETFASLSKKAGISAQCHVDKDDGGTGNGRGSLSN
jgi:hypothetical protein